VTETTKTLYNYFWKRSEHNLLGWDVVGGGWGEYSTLGWAVGGGWGEC